MYAAVRPRFGSGPKSALRVAFFMWLTFWVSTALQSFALGNVPRGLLEMGLIDASWCDRLPPVLADRHGLFGACTATLLVGAGNQRMIRSRFQNVKPCCGSRATLTPNRDQARANRL